MTMKRLVPSFPGMVGLIVLLCLIFIKVDAPVETQPVVITARLADVTVGLPVEEIHDSTYMEVHTSEITIVSPSKFWLVIIPVHTEGLGLWGLRSFGGLLTADADLRGTIISEMFEIKSVQPFTFGTELPKGTQVSRKTSGESLIILIDMPFSAHFGYSVVKPDEKVESTGKNKQFYLSYLGPAVVEGHETEEINMVELPAVNWGAVPLFQDRPLNPKTEALALVLLPISKARYLRTDMDPKQKARQLLGDIQQIPLSFHLGVQIRIKPVPFIEFKPSLVDLVGVTTIEFPDKRIIKTERDDTTRIALVDGDLTIDDAGQLKIEGTASRLTVSGKHGVIDQLSRRVSLWDASPLFVQIIVPTLVGSLLFPIAIIVKTRRPSSRR